MHTFLLTALTVFAPAFSALQEQSVAQEPTAETLSETPIEVRAKQVMAMVLAKPDVDESLFHASFLEAVPPIKMRSILRSYHRQCGAIVELSPLELESETFGRFRALGETGHEFIMTLGVEEYEPHGISTLLFGPASESLRSWKDLEAALKELHGVVTFSVAKLGEGQPKPVFDLQPNVALGIGSAFKLYILGALAEEIAAGKRAWGDTLELKENYRSLPSGILQKWPVGAPVTLHTLASLMISQSDNTATDHLLFLLGRERVEAQVERMGNVHLERFQPFLSTGEMFRLKAGENGRHAEEYLKLPIQARRAFLEEVIWPMDLKLVNAAKLLTPSYIDSIEWFASTHDLCRTMDWLRRKIEAGDTTLAGVLGINPGISSGGAFEYQGYKGGSEGGVLNLTLLIQTKQGNWYALASSWNDTEKVVSEATLVGLMEKALILCAAEDKSK